MITLQGTSVSTRARIAQGLAMALVMVATPLEAQLEAPQASGRPASGAAPRWPERFSVVAEVGQLQAAGNSEWFALLNRAPQPGAGAVDPRIGGAALHYRWRDRWEVVAGYEGGERTASSVSVAHPTGSTAGVAQQTRLSLHGVAYAGIEWRAWRWQRTSTLDRLQLALGAGAGRAGYRVRQWGDFVDATRHVSYRDDFRSTGSGALGYLSAVAEAPVRPWVALRLDVRRQWASAPMTADYASFDRLDLGGVRVALGMRVRGNVRGSAREGGRAH